MAKIKIVKKVQNSLNNKSFLDDRVGFWGNVTGVDSTKNRVSVLSDIGFEFIGIPVASFEWVNKNDNVVSGSRNLPPKGSRVFVFTPTKTITGAFVLCSGYAAGDTETHTLYADDTDKDTKNKIKEIVTPSGWNETENYSTGVKIIESKNGKIKAELNPDSGIVITGWKHVITINENGITLDNSNSDPDSNSDVIIKTDKNINLTGKNVTFDVDDFKIKGGEFAILEAKK